MLPIPFTERMQKMLGEEYEAFEASYALEKKQALRFNPLKGEKEAFLEKVLIYIQELRVLGLKKKQQMRKRDLKMMKKLVLNMQKNQKRCVNNVEST